MNGVQTRVSGALAAVDDRSPAIVTGASESFADFLGRLMKPVPRLPDPVYPLWIAFQIDRMLRRERVEGHAFKVDRVDGSANNLPVVLSLRDTTNGQKYRVTVEVLP